MGGEETRSRRAGFGKAAFICHSQQQQELKTREMILLNRCRGVWDTKEDKVDR